ncbi:MAG: AbrB/MazE/SpoVT family DNA-binding domain-containing protein [archaeon]
MEITTTTRKWGNSLGVTLPAEIVKKANIRERQCIVIEIKTKEPVLSKEVFGAAKTLKLSAQKVKDLMREDDARRDKKLLGHIRAV